MMIRKTLIVSTILCSLCCTAFAQVTTFSFEGKVAGKDGRGISGVVVNDGVSFTTTANDGSWKLSTDTTRSKFVSISIPSDYVLPQRKGLAEDFYVTVGSLVSEGNRHNFVLEKRRNQTDRFYYVAVSDPQVKNDEQFRRWSQETVPDIKKTVAPLAKSREVVGMTLGDLVWDNMQLYAPYKSSLENTGATFFQCIGNHDFDLRYQDLHNMAYGTTSYGEMVYNRYFGPTDYSFNIGKVHVITMKDINYVGSRYYIECLTGEQLEWLRRDLSYVSKGSVVFLNMHAPAWNRVEGSGNVRNADRLKEVLAGYNVHVFTGHTHFFQNNEVTPSLYEHNIGAACGAWWAGWVNQCGAPNGYLVVDVEGTDLKWHFKPTRRSMDYQFRLYRKGEFKSQSSFVVANAWDWDSKCRIVWYEDGKPMGDMEQFTDADEERASQLKDRSKAVKTAHLFRAMPDDGARQIKVELTNRFGEKYTQTIDL